MTTMTVSRQNRHLLKDVPEHRMTARFEVREDADEITLVGYASTFEPYEMYGGPASCGWIEQIDPKAFDKTLREKPDLHLLINHEGMPLARTKSGTLKLSVDNHGLKVVAKLDRSDPDVQRLEPKMRRGDMDEMSFAFRVKAQEWSAAEGFEDDNQSYRKITEISLHKGDVSVVNWGANPTTHAEVKSAADAIDYLARCDLTELAEVRDSKGDEVIVSAIAALEFLTRGKRSTPVASLGGGGAGAHTTPSEEPEARSEAPEGAKPAKKPEPGDAPEGEQRTGGRKPLSLRDALIRQGLADPAGPMSLSEARARIGQADNDSTESE